MTRNVPDLSQTRGRVARAWPLMRAATRALHLYVKAVMRLAAVRVRTRLLRGTSASLAMHGTCPALPADPDGSQGAANGACAMGGRSGAYRPINPPGTARAFSVAVGNAFAGAFRPRPIPALPPSRSCATPLPPALEARDACLAHRLDLLAEAFRNPELHALRMAACIKARGGSLRPVLAIRPDAQAFPIVSDLCAVLPTVTAYPVPDTS